VLCKSADWLIEDNRFFHDQHAAMLLEPDISPGLWSEVFGARNVIIRGNKFESSNSIGASDGPVIEVGATVCGSSTNYPLIDGVSTGHADDFTASTPLLSRQPFPGR